MNQNYSGGYPAAQTRPALPGARQAEDALRGGSAEPVRQSVPGPYFNVSRWPEEGLQDPARTQARTQAQTQAEQAGMPQTITLQMSPGVSQDTVESPLDRQEAFSGSMKALLGKNIGHYVAASFLVGTQNPVSWEGFLYAVGNDYMVIFQPDMNRFITCDLYSLKFIEFHDRRGVVPTCTSMRRRDGSASW